MMPQNTQTFLDRIGSRLNESTPSFSDRVFNRLNEVEKPQAVPDPHEESIKRLKAQGTPLPKILKGIDGLGVENPDKLKGFAENLYNVFNDIDFQGGQPGYKPVVGERGKEAIGKVLGGAKQFAEAVGQAVMNPGSTFATPALEKFGVPAGAAAGIGLGLDVLAPGPGGEAKAVEKGGVKVFQGLKGLSTKLLEKFRGLPNEITPQQFNEVINKATKEGIKKVDLDMVREAAERQSQTQLTDISKAVRKFDQTGTTNVVTGKDYGISVKDEGDFVSVRFGSNKLTPIGSTPSGERNFATKEEAFDFVKQIQGQVGQGKINLSQLAKDVEKQLVPIKLRPLFEGKADEVKAVFSHKEIGDIDAIKGDNDFGFEKIKSSHPEVIPYLEDAFKNGKVVDESGSMFIIEADTDGGKMRILIDTQLGMGKGIEKKTFLNNAYFKSVPREGIEPPTQGSSDLRSTTELPRPQKSIPNTQKKSNADKSGVSGEASPFTVGLGIATSGVGLYALSQIMRSNSMRGELENAKRLDYDNIMAAKSELELAQMLADVELLSKNVQSPEEGEKVSDLMQLLQIKQRQLNRKTTK